MALVGDGDSITYGELARRVDALAEDLLRAVPDFKNRRIGFAWPDGVNHIIGALAILRAGGCLVPLAGELAVRERERLVETTGLEFILAAAPLASGLRAEVLTPIPSLCGDAALWFVPQEQPPAFPVPSFGSLNPAFVRFSSGTTGDKKGVVLSHETLLARITAANEGLRLSPNDRVLWALPMAHHFAVSIILYLWSGVTTVLAAGHLGEDLVATAVAESATVFYGSPFHHRMMAADVSAHRWQSLRLSVSTASPLTADVAAAFFKRHEVTITQGLGIIEVGLPFLNLHSAKEKPLSIGRPLPAYRARIGSSECASGEAEGELFLSGPGIADAYLVPWQTRDAFLHDGWFATGDIVRRDADGDYFILGRVRSVINVGGLKCFPEEIEAVLDTHPGIQRSRVSGRPNESFGSIPVAEFIPADPASPPSTAELMRYCRPLLARYKMPVDFRVVDTIPLTASGKIRRVWEHPAKL